jgi:hypothetical protein
VGTKQLKHNAVTGTKIRNGAVTAAKINTSGLTVPDATHAASADSATSATSASNATHATNSDQLGGVAAAGYQKRVTGTCSTAVSSINQAGGVGCASGVVVPIDLNVAAGSLTKLQVGALEMDFECHHGAGSFVDVDFVNTAATQASLNWFYWAETTPTADGVGLGPGADSGGIGFAGGRIEGQFIYSVHNQEQTTVSLHAVDLTSSCEINGAAEYAPH